MNKTQVIIDKLKMVPHPEGGYYIETYRSDLIMKNENGHLRNVSTAIFYLLEGSDKSHFHRITSDELWFFHSGEAIEILVLTSNGLQKILLGNNFGKGEIPQVLIPSGCWFASHLKEESGYALVSCTVAPGFDFADFEMADRNDLLKEFPDQKEVIVKFTR